LKNYGYKKIRDDEEYILYENDRVDNRDFIDFDLIKHRVSCEYQSDAYEETGALYISMPVLKAINEKVKELGWEE
jgi:hypothetical protein